MKPISIWLMYLTLLQLITKVLPTIFGNYIVFYNGGEVLLFSFEGWFLYGCVAIQKPGLKLLLFVLLAGWLGFFCKSSFIWIYAAGLLCLWLRLSGKTSLIDFIKNGLWIGIPAYYLAGDYLYFLSL